MAKTEIDLNPAEFITIGTIGPRGQRIFHLQAGNRDRLLSFVIEKEQARALSEAIREFLHEVDERLNHLTEVELAAYDMDLREPIQPLFRISQMGLGYDEMEQRVVLALQEMTTQTDDAPDTDETGAVVRIWCTREQMLALSLHAQFTVESGRPDSKMNGRITYYWT